MQTELRFHIDSYARDLVRGGRSQAEAMRQARDCVRGNRVSQKCGARIGRRALVGRARCGHSPRMEIVA
jgi:hypothetical protein